MKNSGYADLPLHNGRVPLWLAQRMSTLGKAIVESIILNYGRDEVMRRLSDPLWFQSLGCVLGMDWHSSGITTSVMGALKKSLNPVAADLGIYICGGRGKHSRQTPDELILLADKVGFDGDYLVRCSKLSAKIDNTAIQDGFQLYLHSFVVSAEGNWVVVQQGMNGTSGMARRYHWHSGQFGSFVNEPHSAVCGINQGKIMNLVANEAGKTRQSVLELTKEEPGRMLPEVRKILMPRHHDVRAKDVNLKRLGTVLALSRERDVKDFESLILLEGLGPRTLQSLVLVSEVIHGTPTRFTDPARFSFAHGGKDGHPFPVPLTVYDETIRMMRKSINDAKIGHYDKQRAVKKLSQVAAKLEDSFQPNTNFNKVVAKERAESYKYGGMTVDGPAIPPGASASGQMQLFD